MSSSSLPPELNTFAGLEETLDFYEVVCDYGSLLQQAYDREDAGPADAMLGAEALGDTELEESLSFFQYDSQGESEVEAGFVSSEDDEEEVELQDLSEAKEKGGRMPEVLEGKEHDRAKQERGAFKVGAQDRGQEGLLQHPSAVGMNRKQRRRIVFQKNLKAANREKAKASRSLDEPEQDYRPPKPSVKVYCRPAREVIDVDVSKFPAAQGAYVGAGKVEPEGLRLEDQDLNRLDHLRCIHWDGGRTVALVDSNGVIIAVLVGRPKDADWVQVLDRAVKTIEAEGAKMDFFHPKCEKKPEARCSKCANRRGDYRSFTAGVSHGTGSSAPHTLAPLFPQNQDAIEAVLKDEDVRRIMGFASSAFAVYCPKLFKELQTKLNSLFVRYQKKFGRMIPGVYPATSINVGPQVVTVEHFDSANLSNAWLALTSLGTFDYTKGGHLIMRSLGVVIQFPPGCTILFPSSVVQHGNVPVQPGEKRMSITQYVSGHLIRWIDYGFRDEEKYLRYGGKQAKEVFKRRPVAWQDSIKKYSKYYELYDDIMSTFYGKG